MENSKQRCPKCGKAWHWSNDRHCEVYRTGRLYLTCKGCGNKYIAWEDKRWRQQ